MDPLAQLKDIHLPNTISDLPIAPGWWLLAIILIMCLSYGLIMIHRYIQRNKARKSALKQLKKADKSQAVIALLKWAALQYFPREQVAKLSGQPFQYFLRKQLPSKHQNDFDNDASPCFSEQYKNNIEDEQLASIVKAAHLWLNHALPPSKNHSSNADAPPPVLDTKQLLTGKS